MYPLYFSAELRTEDGRLMEVGEACLSEIGNSVDFISDFVPLTQLGSTVSIARVLGERTFEVFTGKVYLSTQKLLQIVDVPAPVLEEARRLFAVNENIPVSLALVPDKPGRFNPQKADFVPGTIRYFSQDLIKVIAMEFIPEGQRLTFSVESPAITLDSISVRVTERVLLKRNAAVLLCEVLSPTNANHRAITAFLSRSGRR